MEEQRTTDLEGVQNILLSARIDAACDQWHLDERAIPPLRALASKTGEPRLHKATEHAEQAGQLFDAARKSIAMARSLMDTVDKEFRCDASSPQGTER